MRKVAIMGAGQSGLHLGLRLLQAGYEVSILSEKTAEEIFNGPPTGGTYLFHDSLHLEQQTGLELWKDTALYCSSFGLNFGTPDGQFAFTINTKLKQPGVSIDQRLKFYEWIKLFEERGGHFIVSPSTPADLLACTELFDLVVVSSGKGPLAKLFERDAEKSTWEKPARKLVQLHINNFEHPGKTKFTTLNISVIMGAGEIITAPFYQKDDIQCSWILMEIIPGGPMDVFDEAKTGHQLLHCCKQILKNLVPWQYPLYATAELIEDDAFLKGSFVPTVRKPYIKLNSTATVMGVGDTVILNDPIVGQGGNNATKMAHSYAEKIIAHGDKPFDEAWMQQTFDEFWQYSRYVNRFSDIFLSPPATHVRTILQAATENPTIATDLANGFNHPPSLFPWIDDAQAAQAYLTSRAEVFAPTT
ncbi:hypothetical protein Q0590_35375 [Rhodocytophaga aerolata]|uniref:Styrene monooxygenase StyA putative substrate binding domain-containing protein n=1 Tax=Rhodocytophaga aerolata TaxID=455078 RepID=A0ABT8RHP2_9BACT|nr:styrene monooxygenase/indole monooxygenase family protein [Rhodocytophaga aerolata]MDO1451608.1 hypothetical protein [Rhodocytophaga aerolata]